MDKNTDTPTPETIIKKLATELLRKDTIVVVSEALSINSDNIKYVDSDESLAEHQSGCVAALGLYGVIPELPEQNKKYLDNLLLGTWLVKAESLKLAIAREKTVGIVNPAAGSEDGKVKVTSYSITPKGLEIALKIQEHEDNKERYEQQSNISETLKTNSTRSLYTAWGALFLSTVLIGLGIYRLYLLELKILSHENIGVRISNAETELGKLRDKNDLLVKELEEFKNKPVTTVVAQVDDTHQTKINER